MTQLDASELLQLASAVSLGLSGWLIAEVRGKWRERLSPTAEFLRRKLSDTEYAEIEWLQLYLLSHVWYRRLVPIDRRKLERALDEVDPHSIELPFLARVGVFDGRFVKIRRRLCESLRPVEGFLERKKNAETRSDQLMPQPKGTERGRRRTKKSRTGRRDPSSRGSLSSEIWLPFVVATLCNPLQHKVGDGDSMDYLLEGLRNAMKAKWHVVVLGVLSLMALLLSVGCIVLKYQTAPASFPRGRAPIVEDARLRRQEQLKNPEFRAGTLMWTLLEERGAGGIRPTAVPGADANGLLVNTPHGSAMTIEQSNVQTGAVAYHDYYLDIAVVPLSGGEWGQINVTLDDPIENAHIENVVTPSVMRPLHRIPLPPERRNYRLRFRQSGLANCVGDSVLCLYRYVRLRSQIKAGVIAVTVWKQFGNGAEQLVHYTPTRNDVDFFRVYRYGVDGSTLVLDEFGFSQISSETYIPDMPPGVYRIDATFGGITYGTRDSIALGDSAGIAVEFHEKVRHGDVRVRLVDSLPSQRLERLNYVVYARKGDLESIVRSSAWNPPEGRHPNSRGEFELGWLLSVTRPDESYEIEILDGDSILCRTTDIRPVFGRTGTQRLITITL